MTTEMLQNQQQRLAESLSAELQKTSTALCVTAASCPPPCWFQRNREACQAAQRLH